MLRALTLAFGLLCSTCYPQAERLNMPTLAPAGLDLCADARFYREQQGLPAVFDRYAYRESRCRNDVRTSCCYGIWQLWVDLHLRDPRIVDGYRACGIDEIDDVFGEEPIKRWRQACAVRVLYNVVGLSPWKGG